MAPSAPPPPRTTAVSGAAESAPASASASAPSASAPSAAAAAAAAALAAAVPVAIPGPDGETIQCPHCPKSYSGKHARSIWRRHLQCKHEIPLSIQPRRTRWDGHANRPRNAEERRERMLESKRRWARKKRLQEKAAALGLPPGAEMSLIQQHMRSSATPDLDSASVDSGSTSHGRRSTDAGPPAFGRAGEAPAGSSASPALPGHAGHPRQAFIGPDVHGELSQFGFLGSVMPHGGFVPMPPMGAPPGVYYAHQPGPGPHQGQMPLPHPPQQQGGVPGQVPNAALPLLPGFLPPGSGMGNFPPQYAMGLPLNGQGVPMPPQLDGDFSSSLSLVSSTSLPNMGENSSFSTVGLGNQAFSLSSGNLTAPSIPQPNITLPNRDAEVINLLQQEKREMLERMRQRKSGVHIQAQSGSDGAGSRPKPLGLDVAPPQSTSAASTSPVPVSVPAAAALETVAPSETKEDANGAGEPSRSDEAADAAVQLLVLASPDRPQHPKASSSLDGVLRKKALPPHLAPDSARGQRTTFTPTKMDAFFGALTPSAVTPSSSLMDAFKPPASSSNTVERKHRRVSRSEEAGSEEDEEENEQRRTPRADGASPIKRSSKAHGPRLMPTPRFSKLSSGPGSALRASLAVSPGRWNPLRSVPLSATRGDADLDEDEEPDQDSMLVFSSPQHPDLTHTLGLAPGSLLRSSGYGFPTPGNPFETPLRSRAFLMSNPPSRMDWPASVRSGSRRRSEPESPGCAVHSPRRREPNTPNKSLSPLRADWSPGRATPLRSTPLWSKCRTPRSSGKSPSKSPRSGGKSPLSRRSGTLLPRTVDMNVPKS